MANPISTLTHATASIQTEGLFITHVVYGGRIYQIHAFYQDSNGQTTPLTIPDQATMQRVQSYTHDLFAAHERQRSATNQSQLDVIDVTSQGMVQRDHTILSHDFPIQPIASDIASRMEADLAATPTPISAPAIKAQDIWSRLEQALLPNAPSALPPRTRTTDIHLAPSLDPFYTSPPSHAAPLPFLDTTTRADSTPPLSQLNTPPEPRVPPTLNTPSFDTTTPPLFQINPPPEPRVPPVTNTPSFDTTTPPLSQINPPPEPRVPPTLNTPSFDTTTPPLSQLNSPAEPRNPPVTNTPPAERREPPRTTRPRRDHRPPLQARRLVLSTEHDLKNHDFAAQNWYETIPLRTRLRLCQNIKNCYSTQPMERRVWDKFQAISNLLRTPDRLASNTVELIDEEIRELQRQVSRLPQTLPRETNRLAHSILKRYSQNQEVDTVLTQNINRFPVDDRFHRYFVEQIEAEQLQIAESERATWTQAHCKDDPLRFMRVLERYIDNA